MDREGWHAAVHGAAKSQTRLSDRTELNWNTCDTITSQGNRPMQHLPMFSCVCFFECYIFVKDLLSEKYICFLNMMTSCHPSFSQFLKELLNDSDTVLQLPIIFHTSNHEGIIVIFSGPSSSSLTINSFCGAQREDLREFIEPFLILVSAKKNLMSQTLIIDSLHDI